MPMPLSHAPNGKPLVALVSRDEIALFNSRWLCSTLRDSRAYWFEFDASGNLIDTDCPEQDDGPAASALADDCKAFLFDDVQPEWALPCGD